MDQQEVHQIWLVAQEKVKDRVIAPTLYRAVEKGVGITIDGDEFILGFGSADLPLAGHLRSSQHLAIIEQSISEVAKKKLRLRVIEGTRIEDYQKFLDLKARADQTRVSLGAQRDKERKAEQAWEEVAEKITRGYARLELRQICQNRAAFMRKGFEIINEAVNRMNYGEDSDEFSKRALGRVFEKFSVVMEVPSTMLAYEFFKLREEGKLPTQ